MKRFFSAMIAAAAAAAGCSAGSGYTIEGTDPSFANGKYAYLENDSRMPYTVDSVLVENNTIRFEGEAGEPSWASISYTAEDGERHRAADVFLERGRITLAKNGGNAEAFACTGTPMNDKNARYTETTMSEFVPKIVQAREAGDMKAASEALADYREFIVATICENPDIFGAKLFYDIYGGLANHRCLELAAAFPEELQSLRFITIIKEDYADAARTVAGQPYIDIVQKDADGREYPLAEMVRGEGMRYVFVDFWASWCGPCMAEMPAVKRAREAYRDKGFEVYGVSLDSDRGAWLKAVDDNGLDWPQVCSFEVWNSQACKDYGIHSIPSNFLIDCSTGKIAATSLEGVALERKLAELFAE